MKKPEVIDFHTHVFPDEIAPRALKALSEHSGPYRPCTDGTLSGLLSSMDSADISLSVVANIATRPTQLMPILEFSKKIKSDRIYPLVSFHPQNSHEEVRQLLQEAEKTDIKGVKLHPMYQGFSIDEKRMFPFYELFAQKGFFVVFHTGYDIAFPGNLQASIDRVVSVARDFPGLQIVTTHTGGWRQWDRLELLIEFENVYTEISMTITETGRDRFTELLMSFPEHRIFFGTDSPWTDQKDMVGELFKLDISESLRDAILYRNAAEFLKRL